MILPRWVQFYLPAGLVECGAFMLILAQPIDALERLGAGAIHLGLLGMLGNGGYALVAVMAGRWSDRFGRRGPILFGIGSQLVLALTLPLTTTLWQLMTLAVVQMTLLGFFWAPFMGALGESIVPARLSAMLGRFNISWCLGSAGAAMISTVLYLQYGTRAPYLGAAVILLPAVVLIAVGRPRLAASEDGTHHPPRWRVRFFKNQAWMVMAANFFMGGMLIFLYPKLVAADGMELAPAGIAALHVARLLVMLVIFALMGATVGWHFRIAPFHVSYGLLVAAMLLTAWADRPALALIPFVLVGVTLGMAYGLSVYYSGLETAKGYNFGIHESLLAVGSTTGPIYGGLLMHYTDWPPLAFLLGAVPLALLWAASAVAMSRTIRRARAG